MRHSLSLARPPLAAATSEPIRVSASLRTRLAAAQVGLGGFHRIDREGAGPVTNVSGSSIASPMNAVRVAHSPASVRRDDNAAAADRDFAVSRQQPAGAMVHSP